MGPNWFELSVVQKPVARIPSKTFRLIFMRRHGFCACRVSIVSNCFFLSLYYHLHHITIQININNRIFIKWPTVHIKLMHRHAFNCVRGNQPVLWISTSYLTLTFIWCLHFQHISNIIFISRHTAPFHMSRFVSLRGHALKHSEVTDLPSYSSSS